MLVMAIEASRQLSDPTKSIVGFRFSDVSFKKALRLPNDEGVESHFYMRSSDETDTLHGAGWNEFQLSTLAGDDWVENCRGYVRLDYATNAPCPTNGYHEHDMPNGETSRYSDLKEISKSQLYNAFRTFGNIFGPYFQNLENIRAGPTATQTEVKNPVRDIEAAMPYQHLQPHIIHPATLDGVIQANLVPMVCNVSHSAKAFVPFYARDLWISARTLGLDDSFTVTTHSEQRGPLKVESRFTAISNNTGSTMVSGEGFILRPVPGSEIQVRKSPKHVAFHVEWKPDLDFSTPISIVEGTVE